MVKRCKIRIVSSHAANSFGVAVFLVCLIRKGVQHRHPLLGSLVRTAGFTSGALSGDILVGAALGSAISASETAGVHDRKTGTGL